MLLSGMELNSRTPWKVLINCATSGNGSELATNLRSRSGSFGELTPADGGEPELVLALEEWERS